MNKRGRSQLALGVILILVGVWFLLDKTMPQFHDLFSKYTVWPFNMFLIGAGILLIGLFTGQPGMAVPAAVVAGIGGIFLYQKGDGDSWSYMWALIPGFVGIGTMVAGLLGDNTARNLKRGLNLVIISAALFIVFASTLGKLNILGAYGPAILLMLLGAWVLGKGIYSSYRRSEE